MQTHNGPVKGRGPRAGWPSPLSLLMVIPLVNFVLLWVLAFKRWPGEA